MKSQATLLVCDEIRLEMTGKLILIGTYTSDMMIPAPGFVTPQMVFFLIFEGPLAERPTEGCKFEVTLPGQKPSEWPIIFQPNPPPVPEGRTKFIMRHGWAIQSPVLNPGHIKGRVITSKGEISVGGPWITLPPQQIVSPAPNA
jgi:hypothetical protein